MPAIGKDERYTKAQALVQLREDIKALNSAISILSQKLRNITRNEKILGRNLIVLNKKVKELAEMQGTAFIDSGIKEKIEAIEKQVKENSRKIAELRAIVSQLQKESVSADEVKELKNLFETINPLELVTIDQVKELIKKAKQKGQL